jgi:hypothetical protein
MVAQNGKASPNCGVCKQTHHTTLVHATSQSRDIHEIFNQFNRIGVKAVRVRLFSKSER